MKTVVMLTCLRASAVCTGAGCFTAFNRRTHRFAEYGDEPLEILAFMRCSGCGKFPGKDAGLDEKLERILSMKPDAVHLGICCCHDAREKDLCEEIRAAADLFAQHGIRVIRGTHSIF